MKNPQLKSRLIEIVITALFAALLAFLQGLLTGLAGVDLPSADPGVAGSLGGGLKALLAIRK